jgi:hypothetical protein
MFVMGCASPCQFLGSTENTPKRAEPETQPKPEEPTVNDEQTPVEKTQIAPATWCSSCNVEMDQSRTKFRIEGFQQAKNGISGTELAAIVYLCPQCGKIEFKADKS